MVSLFTLMGDKHIESFDEKSIMAHRILGFKKVEYENNIASMDSLTKDIGKSVGMFPIIRHQGIVIYDITKLETFFKEHPPAISKDIYNKPYFVKMITEWALDSFSKKARFFLLHEPENWGKLKRYLTNIYPGDEQVEILNSIKNVSYVVYKTSLFARLDYAGKLDALDQDFSMIEYWASQSEFLAGDDVSTADFAVFAILHLLFHPNIDETATFKDKYPYMNAWAVKFDALTRNGYTKAIHLKKI